MKVRLVHWFWAGLIGFVYALNIEANEISGLVINSGEVQYDGKKIVLVDNVHVEHGLGKITTDHFSIESIEKKNKARSSFSILNMSGNVFIELSGGGTLSCDKAEVDCGNLKGFFFSSPGSANVTYKSSLGEGPLDFPKPSFVLNSELMSMKLVREAEKSSKSRKTLVQDIEALHQVKLEYNKKYVLLADRAFYQRIPISGQSNTAGLLTMSMEGTDFVCLLSMVNEDYVRAKKVELDTIRQQLSLKDVYGLLSMEGEDAADHRWNFTADQLILSDSEQFLQFIGNVCVKDQAGEVYANEMWVNYEKKNRQLVPLKIILKGNVRLINRFNGHIKDPASILHYALAECVEYFPDKQEVLLTGTKTDQVLFFDQPNHLQVSAQSLRIIYDSQTKKESIQGIGQVRFKFMDRELNQLKTQFDLGGVIN